MSVRDRASPAFAAASGTTGSAGSGRLAAVLAVGVGTGGLANLTSKQQEQYQALPQEAKDMIDSLVGGQQYVMFAITTNPAVVNPMAEYKARLSARDEYKESIKFPGKKTDYHELERMSAEAYWAVHPIQKIDTRLFDILRTDGRFVDLVAAAVATSQGQTRPEKEASKRKGLDWPDGNVWALYANDTTTMLSISEAMLDHAVRVNRASDGSSCAIS